MPYLCPAGNEYVTLCPGSRVYTCDGLYCFDARGVDGIAGSRPFIATAPVPSVTIDGERAEPLTGRTLHGYQRAATAVPSYVSSTYTLYFTQPREITVVENGKLGEPAYYVERVLVPETDGENAHYAPGRTVVLSDRWYRKFNDGEEYLSADRFSRDAVFSCELASESGYSKGIAVEFEWHVSVGGGQYDADYFPAGEYDGTAGRHELGYRTWRCAYTDAHGARTATFVYKKDGRTYASSTGYSSQGVRDVPVVVDGKPYTIASVPDSGSLVARRTSSDTVEFEYIGWTWMPAPGYFVSSIPA